VADRFHDLQRHGLLSEQPESVKRQLFLPLDDNYTSPFVLVKTVPQRQLLFPLAASALGPGGAE
jgi:hypothetical protein